MFSQSFETYDLKLVQTCIFLRESDPACLSGTFHINLPHSSSFKGIRVNLVGRLNIPKDGNLIQNDRHLVTHNSEQTIGSSQKLNSFQLPAGNYEFPFSIPLAGRMLETITGRRHTYHSYHVQAVIERRFRANSIISRPVRIYHHPDLWADHQLSSMSSCVEGRSDHQIQYCISLPDSKIPFGSKFSVKCYFSPLRKNLKLTNISLAILEKHNLRVDATAAESAMHNILTMSSARTVTIFESEHDIPTGSQSTETSLTTDSEDSNSDSTTGTDDIPPAEWSLELPVQLPESFDFASQSVSTKPVKIGHRLIVRAQFLDTETNTPITVEETIPFLIYMTPAVIDEDGNIHGQDLECFEGNENANAPPAYGQHKCDAIPGVDWMAPGCLEQFQVSDGGGLRRSGEQCGLVPRIDNDPPAYQFCAT